MADPDDSRRHPAVKLTPLLVLGAGLLALFLGKWWFWTVFALGFAVLVPVAELVTDEFAGEDETATGTETEIGSDADSASKGDALDTLRERYARGELTDAEFEREVEALLETETPESVRRRVERTRTGAGTDTGADTDTSTGTDTSANADTSTSSTREAETESNR